MMLGEKQMMEVLILDQGTVQYRSVSSPPLASHWWAVTSYRRNIDTDTENLIHFVH